MKSLTMLAALFVSSAACSSDTSPGSGPGGKADDPSGEESEDGTYDDSSGIGCLFGDHLVTMARMADLKVSDEEVLSIESELSAVQAEQLLDHARRQTAGFADIEGLKDVFANTDDDEISFRTVEDLAHGRKFHLYVHFAGDNAVGSIYYARSLRLAAEIGDGDIGKCDAGYSNFEDLPFFYTN